MGQIKKIGGKKKVVIILSILLVVIIGLLIKFAMYVHSNIHYTEKPLERTYEAGYIEKQVELENGTILNYGEGPDNGIPLLLIHGQTMSWEDYSRVLPELAEKYHVYAIDCHGHGESSHNISQYSCEKIGNDFAWFIENVIGEPCVVSGHSSGGILAAWLAAYSPENVLGIVLEDPPLFKVTPETMENTFVWKDGFEIIHGFLNQSQEKDYIVYYMKNSYIFSLFGGLRDKLVKTAEAYREDNPGEPLKIWYLPHSMIQGLFYMDDYDLQFGEQFHNGNWMAGINQEEMLQKIQCPAVYIKVNTQYGKDGVLYAANTDEDAERVNMLIKGSKKVNIKSTHNVHFQCSDEFVSIINEFVENNKLDLSDAK